MDNYTGQQPSAHKEAASTQEGGQSAEKFDYRLLVGFLTETIDNCVRKNHQLRTSEDGPREAVRSRCMDQMGIAMQALENTIRLIMVELEMGEKSLNQSAGNTTARPTKDWLRLVFPDNSAGEELMASFRKQYCPEQS